jgi:plasmid stability protein
VAQLIIRNLEESVKARLKKRAERNGRSMEAEAREILRNAAKHDESHNVGLGSKIARRFRGLGLTGDIPEMQFKARVPKFTK